MTRFGGEAKVTDIVHWLRGGVRSHQGSHSHKCATISELESGLAGDLRQPAVTPEGDE